MSLIDLREMSKKECDSSLTFDEAMIRYYPDKLNTDLSRAAEGTGPVKPDNLCVSIRCQILRETER